MTGVSIEEPPKNVKPDYNARTKNMFGKEADEAMWISA